MSILRDLFGPGTWGTGGNLVAWVICGAVAGTGAWLLRDRLGPALAAWWHRHHAGHLRGELAAMEERLKAHAEQHHEAVRERLDAIQRAQRPPGRMTAADEALRGRGQERGDGS